MGFEGIAREVVGRQVTHQSFCTFFFQKMVEGEVVYRDNAGHVRGLRPSQGVCFCGEQGKVKLQKK